MAGESKVEANDTKETTMEQHIEIYAITGDILAIHRNPHDTDHGYAQYVTGGKYELISYNEKVNASIRLVPTDTELSPILISTATLIPTHL